jgi:hypothetical protein
MKASECNIYGTCDCRLRRYGPVHSRPTAVLRTQTVRPCSLQTYHCPTHSDGTALFFPDLHLSYRLRRYGPVLSRLTAVLHNQSARPCSLQTYHCPTHSDGTALFYPDLPLSYRLRRYGLVHSIPVLNTRTVRPCSLHTYRCPTNQTVRPCSIHTYICPIDSADTALFYPHLPPSYKITLLARPLLFNNRTSPFHSLT